MVLGCPLLSTFRTDTCANVDPTKVSGSCDFVYNHTAGNGVGDTASWYACSAGPRRSPSDACNKNTEWE
jgi:hypothetical protein